MNRRIDSFCICALTALGCSSSDTVNYGPPGGLVGKNLPSPARSITGDDAATPSGSGSSSGSASGSEAGSGSVSDAGGSALTADASLHDGGCSVSWANQIFPAMVATGKWRCSDLGSCHGSGLQSPKMTSDPSATYRTLSGYTMVVSPKKLPYILPGNTDPSQSGIECNLSGFSCGPQMPLTTAGAVLLDPSDIQVLDTWVKCGSPNN